MAKNKITASFRLFSMPAVLISTLMSKIMHVLYTSAASDVTVSDIWAYVARGASELLSLLSVAFTVSITVYAHSYFGKRTAVQASLISLACLFSGKLFMYIYAVIANELSAAQLISGALSYISEVVFDCIVLILAILLSMTFAKRRAVSGKIKAYSPTKAAVCAAGAYFFLLIVDLSAMNVIPFFVKYSDPRPSELLTIASDYLYYLFSFGVTSLLILLSFLLLTKVTGKLQLKNHYEPKQ